MQNQSSSSILFPEPLCQNKLYNEDSILDLEALEQICTSLLVSPDFLLRVRKHTEGLVTNSVILQGDSAKFFNLKCPIFPGMCQNGTLVDLYTEDKLIIIQPGSVAKKKVTDGYRQRVIESMRYNLLKNEWGPALSKAVDLLEYKEQNGPTVLNLLQSREPSKFMWAILIPILAFVFFVLTAFLVLISKGKISPVIFNYVNKLLDLWEEIENSNDKCIVIPPRTCLFCLKQGNQEDEGKNIFRFIYCNHYYHYLCMYKWGLHTKKCCPCSFEPVENGEYSTPESNRPPLLCVDDIRNLMGFLLDAHRKENLYDYFVEHEKKIERFNEKYNVSLEEMCWIYSNKLENYKKYRIFYKMWRVSKLMCCIITFYPSKYINSKQGRLIRRLLNVKSTGSTIGGFK